VLAKNKNPQQEHCGLLFIYSTPKGGEILWKKNESTSKRVASQASKILRGPKSTKAEKSVAASALTQKTGKK
jgi:hypothetical protein